MVLSWWRRWRRNRILARPFPPEWEGILERNVRQYRRLSDAERARLRRCVQVLVAEKYWEGCRGFEITDEVRVTLAGHASLLLLGREDEYFDRLTTILVYAETYVAPEKVHNPAGVVTEAFGVRLGEAWHAGPVVLSWSNVSREGYVPDEGLNVVLHEFAHVLDMEDHAVDGTPRLESAEQYRTWHEVMTAEFEALVEDDARGRASLLDTYGTTDEAEFFAVATECFFEQPVEMARRHPRLYNLLRDYYRQDPAARGSRPRTV